MSTFVDKELTSMYFIEPYKSMGNLDLNSTPSEIEMISGKGHMIRSELTPEYVNVHYGDVMVSYRDNTAHYIGVISPSLPVHLNFNFSNKGYDEVLEYFREYPDSIYIEGETSIVSEFLGISTYFEEGLNEVAIFSKDYYPLMIADMENA